MKRLCRMVVFDWHYTTDGGEQYGIYELGKPLANGKIPECIDYHEAQGPGDQHYVDVTPPPPNSDGEVRRLFNLSQVVFLP